MDRKNSKKLKNLNWLIYIAILLFVIALVLYFYNFRYGLSDKGADWGTFGDFMGGTLNPLFAFLSLLAIIYTIRIQTQELELSRMELKETQKEIEKSRVAQEEQSKSLEKQNYSIELQTFENTFFKLMTLLLDTKNNIEIDIELNIPTLSKGYILVNGQYPVKYSNNFILEKKLNSYKAIKMYLEIFKIKNDSYDKFNFFYESNTGTYFGQIYQVLKFINESDVVNKQYYVNVFRAQFTKEELEFLFYHCLGKVGSRKFKKLVEDFEFFEHLSFNKAIEKNICKYHISAYGKNELLLTKYAEQSVVPKPNI